MKRTYLLFSIVVAIALLLAASEVRAVTPLPPPYPLSPGVAAPRECTITGWGGVQVKIQAGPADGWGLSAQFPLSDICTPPGATEGEPCLKWQYRWTVTGGNASLKEALVSVDSDITVLTTDKSAHVSKILQTLNIGEAERFLVFPASGTSFSAEYYTPLNVTPGTLTAGFVGNKLFLWGHCALPGANNVIVEPYLAVPSLSYQQLPGCLVSFAVNSTGMPIPGTTQLTGPDCPDIHDPLKFKETLSMEVDGDVVVGSGPMQWTTQGASCTYCFKNTAGGKTCVTTATCK